jgi:hypothetical protein
MGVAGWLLTVFSLCIPLPRYLYEIKTTTTQYVQYVHPVFNGVECCRLDSTESTEDMTPGTVHRDITGISS